LCCSVAGRREFSQRKQRLRVNQFGFARPLERARFMEAKYTAAMSRRRPDSEPSFSRLATRDVVRVQAFIPLWLRCSRCSDLAYMTPQWPERKAECKCSNCGAVYSISLSADYSRLYIELPLWLKADFRSEVFWALNGEHLAHLERVIRATLRERPVV